MERGAHDVIAAIEQSAKEKAIAEYLAAEAVVKKYYWVGYPVSLIIGLVVGHFVL